MPSEEEILEECRKLRHLRTIVDLVTAILYQGNLSIPEMLELIKATRRQILAMFPDKEEAYNLIYKPRFERIIKEWLMSN